VHFPRAARKKLGLSLASLALLFAAGEAGLRIAGFAPLEELRANSVWSFLAASDDPVLGYELIPRAHGAGFGTEVSVNSLGFRGREIELEKPQGARRIVVLGDSITFGNDLSLEETYPQRVEDLLAQAGHAAQVCNLGVTGYDTLQQAIALERVGLRLCPDVVVVGFCFNDVGTVSLEQTQFERARDYGSPLFRSRVAQWLAQRYEDWRLIRGYHDRNRPDRFLEENRPFVDDLGGDRELLDRMGALADGLARVERDPPGWSPLPWYASAAHVGKLRHAFTRLADLAREGGFPLVVVILPCLRENPFQAAHDQAYALVAGEARRLGMDVLSLAREVRAAGGATLRIRPNDWIHYNAAGHRLIAERLAHHLVTQGYLR